MCDVDTDRSLECLKSLSRMASKAVYNHDFPMMAFIDDSISRIETSVDSKLESLKMPDDPLANNDTARAYRMACMKLMPVSFTLDTMRSFLLEAMAQAENEIDIRIRELQKLAGEHDGGSNGIPGKKGVR